jgi:hypothetical protein
MKRKVTLATIATLLLLLMVVGTTQAAVTFPSFFSSETQKRLQDWFLLERWQALNSAFNDTKTYIDGRFTAGTVNGTFNNLVINGTSNLKGNVSNSTGTLTVADNVLIDGQADAAQLVIQGHSTQTNPIFLVEASNGADKFTISNDGNVVVYGTSDLRGNVANSTGTLTLNDDVSVAGTTALAGNVSVGGGYGTTGCSITSAGVLSCDGAITSDAGFIGMPRMKYVGVGVYDGTATTEVLVDDTPDGEWSALGGNTGTITVTADATIYKAGSKSLKLAFGSDVVPTDGVESAGPNGDWTTSKSIGFWVYADSAFTAAQLTLYLTDATDPATFNTCAYATPDEWLYCEVDISSLSGTQGDLVTDISFLVAGDFPVPSVVYIDEMVRWTAADEVSLTVDAAGDLGFINATALTSLTRGVDYTIAWRTGVDYFVFIADLDPDGAYGWVAY